MSGLVSGLIAAVVVYGAYRFLRPSAGVAFERDDPRLLAAKQEAVAALPQFWAALEAKAEGDEDFAIKFNLLHGADSANNESIWAGDVVRRQAIDDWGFYRGGVAQGHFVTRLMLDSAPAGVARQQRKVLGWD